MLCNGYELGSVPPILRQICGNQCTGGNPEDIVMSISQMSIELLLFLASILASDETPQITNDANLIVSRDSSGLVDLDGHVTHL